jgi:hypothetical protein
VELEVYVVRCTAVELEVYVVRCTAVEECCVEETDIVGEASLVVGGRVGCVIGIIKGD